MPSCNPVASHLWQCKLLRESSINAFINITQDFTWAWQTDESATLRLGSAAFYSCLLRRSWSKAGRHLQAKLFQAAEGLQAGQPCIADCPAASQVQHAQRLDGCHSCQACICEAAGILQAQARQGLQAGPRLKPHACVHSCCVYKHLSIICVHMYWVLCTSRVLILASGLSTPIN